MSIEQLVKEIEECAARRGLAPATITSRGVGSSRLYRLLKSGKDCTHRTAAKLRAFMAVDPPRKGSRK